MPRTGTPHRGSDTTSRADRILRLTAGISNIDPNFGHRELQITNESWLHIAHNYTVVSFYETVPMNTGISRMVGISIATTSLAHLLAARSRLLD